MMSGIHKLNQAEGGETMEKDVLIIGGGIAALNSALEIANLGFKVHLVASEAGLGGQLINTGTRRSETSLHCIWDERVNIPALYLGGNIHASTSILGSLIMRVTNNPNISTYLSANLSELSGNIGNFKANIWTPEGSRELNVGAIITAIGYTLYDAVQKGEYGYKEYPAVMTSLEYENLLHNQARSGKSLLRPHDGKPVQHIGFIQCVGSRDTATAEYCSSLCCMFTAKEAILTKELFPEVDMTIYYLDLRACGKNFDQFIDHAKNLGAKYIRTMISDVKENPVTANLSVRFMNNDTLTQQDHDLLVLATGIRPNKDAAVLADTLEISLNKYGYIDGLPLQPYMTERPGVFTVTSGEGPLDVPDTLALSSAASAAAVYALGPIRTKTRPQITENKTADVPSVAVLLCAAGLNSLNANEDAVIKYAQATQNVNLIHVGAQACNAQTIKHFCRTLEDKNIDRIVAGPCPLRTNQYLFQEMAERSGINRFLVEQTTYPINTVTSDALDGTAKTAELLRRSIELVKTHRPLYLQPVSVTKKALVIGAGISGMCSALEIAENGYNVYLIEKAPKLGGYAQRLYKTIDGQDVQQMLTVLKNKILSHPLVEVLTNVEILDTQGRPGHFSTTVRCGETALKLTRTLEHGVTIIATGTKENIYLPEYLYGKNERVITNTDLQYLFSNGWKSQGPSTYVFIQCAGSRDEQHPSCGRTCCSQTIANAITIKTQNPAADIYVLFRDIRTPGFMEQYYKEARQKGVIFVPYEDHLRPRISDNGSLTVSLIDPISGTELNIAPNLLVLATARIPSAEAEQLADKFHLQKDKAGFMMETHSGFSPIGFPSGGIFVTGTAHAPKSIAACVTQAQGVAGRATNILSQPFIMLGGIVAEVDPDKCAACLTCVRTCPFGVPKIDRSLKEMGAASIAWEECRGCGICTGECPNKAIELKQYEDDQMAARLNKLMMEVC